jgi:DNA-binding MarR family transcriptional regulator
MRDINLVGALALAISDSITAATAAATKAAAAETGPAAAALMLVAHLPGMSIDALRTGVSLSHPGAVRLVDRLEAAGLIERRACRGDGRRVALHLTPEGEAAAATIAQDRVKAVAGALAALPEAEQARFARTCETLLTALVGGPADALRICRLCDDRVCDNCPVEGCLALSDA